MEFLNFNDYQVRKKTYGGANGNKISLLCSNKKLVIKNKFHNDTLHRPHINQ